MPFTKSSQPSKSPLLGFTMFYQHISLIEEVVTIPEKLSHRGVRKVVIVSKKFLEWSEFGNTSSMCSSKEPTVWGTWTPCAGIQCVYIYDMIYGIWHMTHYNTLYVSIHYIYIQNGHDYNNTMVIYHQLSHPRHREISAAIVSAFHRIKNDVGIVQRHLEVPCGETYG